jgi:hypothetical protein
MTASPHALSLAWQDLGSALLDLAQLDQPQALDEGIDALRRSIAAWQTPGPARPGQLADLAGALALRWSRYNDDDEAEVSLQYLAACDEGMRYNLDRCASAGAAWGRWEFQRARWAEASNAYSVALDALHRLFAVQVMRPNKELWLRQVADVSARTVYAAVGSGDLEAAVTGAERGRALLLSEALQRMWADVQALRASGHGDLADRYLAAAHRMARLSG